MIRKQTIEEYRESIMTCSKLDSVFTKVSINNDNNTTHTPSRRGRKPGRGRGRGRGGASRANCSAPATPVSVTLDKNQVDNSYSLANGRAYSNRKAQINNEEQSLSPKVNGFVIRKNSNRNINDSPNNSSNINHRANARGVSSARLRGVVRARNISIDDKDSIDKIRRSPRKTGVGSGDDTPRSTRSSRRKFSDR